MGKEKQNVKALIKQVLCEKENHRYHRFLAKKKGSYDQWLAGQEVLWRQENASGLRDEKIDVGFVLIRAASGSIPGYARESIMRYFMQHPQTEILYGDEDVQEADGKKRCPVFKPDWSPDVLDSCFYFGSLVAVRSEFFDKLQKNASLHLFLRKTEKNEYSVTDYFQYVHWMYQCVQMAGGYQKGARGIGHVPQILFHCESLEDQSRYRVPLCFGERCQEYENDLERAFQTGTKKMPLVSVVIPSRDHPELLEKCIRAVIAAAMGIRLEIFVVDNGSTQENKGKTEKLIQNLTQNDIAVFLIYRPMDFNFSRMCNLGAQNAAGDILLFLNDDVELVVQGCMKQMAALAVRPYTGAVGLKLYYPGSQRIQHAGITNLPMGPVHKLQFLEEGRTFGSARGGNVNYLAVTAACLMVQRKKFLEAGGFAEELQVAFNDVDLCFTLYESGYQNVCMNGIYAYHYESLSRGDDEAADKLERLLVERDKLYERHPGLEGVDPYYSIHLNREGLATCIRPAYETAGNLLQKEKKAPREKSLRHYRKDECVALRIESVRSGEILGWCAVLGDNNACYKRELVLKKADPSLSGKTAECSPDSDGVYRIPLWEQYRPDLQENMPDQENVALCGFHICLESGLLPAGRYRIGAAVRHRITGACLMNWSNRHVEL